MRAQTTKRRDQEPPPSPLECKNPACTVRESHSHLFIVIPKNTVTPDCPRLRSKNRVKWLVVLLCFNTASCISLSFSVYQALFGLLGCEIIKWFLVSWLTQTACGGMLTITFITRRKFVFNLHFLQQLWPQRTSGFDFYPDVFQQLVFKDTVCKKILHAIDHLNQHYGHLDAQNDFV